MSEHPLVAFAFAFGGAEVLSATWSQECHMHVMTTKAYETYLPLRAECISQEEKLSLLLPSFSRKCRYTLVIHGGAGTLSKAGSTPEQHLHYKEALSTALEAVNCPRHS